MQEYAGVDPQSIERAQPIKQREHWTIREHGEFDAHTTSKDMYREYGAEVRIINDLVKRFC